MRTWQPRQKHSFQYAMCILVMAVALLTAPSQALAARIINSVTLGGASSITVLPSANITAVVNVTTSGLGSERQWKSTGWLISTNALGTFTCIDHNNNNLRKGTYSLTFTITAPTLPGTYNAYFIAYKDNSCGSGGSNVYTMANAVVVSIPPPVGGVATAFNAIDEAYGLSPSLQDFLSGHIYMKLVGTPFKLNVAALNNGQIVTNYAAASNKAVTVKLVDNSDGTCVLDGSQANYCSATCKAKAAVTGGSQTMPLHRPMRARQTGNFTLNTAYKNLVAIISDGTATACSTDALSVRPQSFAPAVITAANVGQTVFKADSDPFTIAVTTSGVAGYPAGYTGVPKVNNTALTAVSPATVAGTVGGTFAAAVSGTPTSTATGTNFKYTEAGSFMLPAQGIYEGVLASECGGASCSVAAKDALKAASWTGVDSISTKNDCVDESYSNVKDAGGKYGCLFGATASSSFGRFTPDHFTLLDDFVQGNQSVVVAACGGASGFTYMGQPFNKLAFQLEARNGTNGKTQNYTGAVATAVVTVVAEDSDNGTNLTSRMTGVPTGTWTAGSYAVDAAAAKFIRLQTSGAELTPDGMYDNLQLGINVVDADGVTMGGANMNPATAGACGVACDSRRINDTSAAAAQTTKVRFGCLKLSNAHGSDKLDLPIPMRAEYWNGATGMFVTNALDNCTQISCANAALLNYRGGVTAGNMPTANVLVGSTCTTPETLTAGVGRLKLKKPTGTFAAKGSVEVCVDLGADTPAVCTATSAAQPWLQGKWRGTDPEYNDDPWGRATFGVYKNANEFIYFREMY